MSIRSYSMYIKTKLIIVRDRANVTIHQNFKIAVATAAIHVINSAATEQLEH